MKIELTCQNNPEFLENFVHGLAIEGIQRGVHVTVEDDTQSKFKDIADSFDSRYFNIVKKL